MLYCNKTDTSIMQLYLIIRYYEYFVLLIINNLITYLRNEIYNVCLDGVVCNADMFIAYHCMIQLQRTASL